MSLYQYSELMRIIGALDVLTSKGEGLLFAPKVNKLKRIIEQIWERDGHL